jgi:SAM-dependent methyltransferase
MPRDLAAAEKPGWLLDEVARAGRENLDAGHVARYDAKEDAGAGDEVLLCQQLGLGRESTVVDVGAGTGQFAVAVAPVCARVVAVDVSGVMLDRLRAKVDEAGLSNVEVPTVPPRAAFRWVGMRRARV